MAIILDMDGTILDAAPSIVRCLNQTFEELGYEPLTLDEALGFSGIPLDGILRTRMSEEELPHARERYRAIHYSSFTQDTEVYPHAREVLERWKAEGKRLAVFTLRRGVNAREILKHFDLLHLFDGVIGHDEAPEPKPSPTHVETAADTTDTHPKNTIVVGDNHVDILSGNSAGAKTIGVLWGLGTNDVLHESGAWKTARNWKHLEELVAKHY